MLIDPSLWPKLHGASTHFPVALAMAATLFDGLGFILPETSRHKRGRCSTSRERGTRWLAR